MKGVGSDRNLPKVGIWVRSPPPLPANCRNLSPNDKEASFRYRDRYPFVSIGTATSHQLTFPPCTSNGHYVLNSCPSRVSRYSSRTSSYGTSCVRTSPSSASSASSTPFATSASNAFPSSSNSSTLSESAPWMLDNPCKSPVCSPARAPSPSSANGTLSTLWFFPRTCF